MKEVGGIAKDLGIMDEAELEKMQKGLDKMAANPMAAMESAVGEFGEMMANPAAYMEKMIKKMMDVGLDKMKSVIEK